jgi:hypothetical protein
MEVKQTKFAIYAQTENGKAILVSMQSQKRVNQSNAKANRRKSNANPNKCNLQLIPAIYKQNNAESLTAKRNPHQQTTNEPNRMQDLLGTYAILEKRKNSLMRNAKSRNPTLTIKLSKGIRVGKIEPLKHVGRQL